MQKNKRIRNACTFREEEEEDGEYGRKDKDKFTKWSLQQNQNRWILDLLNHLGLEEIALTGLPDALGLEPGETTLEEAER